VPYAVIRLCAEGGPDRTDNGCGSELFLHRSEAVENMLRRTVPNVIFAMAKLVLCSPWNSQSAGADSAPTRK